ncbi:MAG TPA: hypothetical protein PKD86_00785 [Gemmatales bacterium]|nr:hypothetical protein [Gemmatales bacterium]HMP57859.1 hypothetical protein [Gemmatales bacterium]
MKKLCALLVGLSLVIGAAGCENKPTTPTGGAGGGGAPATQPAGTTPTSGN